MAFQGESLITLGSENGFDLDWAATWTDKLSKAQQKANKSIAEAGMVIPYGCSHCSTCIIEWMFIVISVEKGLCC